jgi:PPOX class probable F420-dependent enzyme
MPGYGIDTTTAGLITWDEAARRLNSTRNFWLATVRPDGRPHVMAVWAVWLDDALWFSSSLRSRKIRNLRENPRCTLTCEDAEHPIVVEGTAEIIVDLDRIGTFLAASNTKYDVDYRIEFLDPAVNATVRVAPSWAFALDEENFTGSPTRWQFDP